jgi:hypothetical protein
MSLSELLDVTEKAQTGINSVSVEYANSGNKYPAMFFKGIQTQGCSCEEILIGGVLTASKGEPPNLVLVFRCYICGC